MNNSPKNLNDEGIVKQGKHPFAPMRRIVLLGELPLTLYSLGWLSLFLQRSVRTLLRWEQRGILPNGIFCADRAKGDFRWYSAAEIIGYSHIAKNTSLKRGFFGEFEGDKLRLRFAEYRTKLKEAIQKDPQFVAQEIPEWEKISNVWNPKHQKVSFNKFEQLTESMVSQFSAKLKTDKPKAQELNEDKHKENGSPIREQVKRRIKIAGKISR